MSDFFQTLDAIVAGDGSKKHVIKVKRSAKEELDNNSSQEDFMNAVADAVAGFIRDNRNAFDLDDSSAISEFVQVVQLEEIQSRILNSLQTPEEDEVSDDEIEDELANDEGTSDEDEISLDDTSSDNDELVSDDVMAMLDKED